MLQLKPQTSVDPLKMKDKGHKSGFMAGRLEQNQHSKVSLAALLRGLKEILLLFSLHVGFVT